MENLHLNSLLHLSDPTLPIGSFSHSNGLETYVQKGIVRDAASAEIFIENMLFRNFKHNDASFVRLAYEAAVENNLWKIIRLDQECTALKSPKEIRQASQKLGVRLLKIFKDKIDNSLLWDFEESVHQNEAAGHYCIVFGMCSCLLEILKKETVLAFYYNATTGMVTNSVKLIPLGQFQGQNILFRIQQQLPGLVQETLSLERESVGICNPGFDIRGMQHEQLYSRLYMS